MKLEPLRNEVTEGEKRAWLAWLRGANPISKEARRELAEILEHRFFFPKRGAPRLTGWGKTNRKLRAQLLRHYIGNKIEQLKARREHPRGGLVQEAQARVADELGITVDSLKKQISPREK